MEAGLKIHYAYKKEGCNMSINMYGVDDDKKAIYPLRVACRSAID